MLRRPALLLVGLAALPVAVASAAAVPVASTAPLQVWTVTYEGPTEPATLTGEPAIPARAGGCEVSDSDGAWMASGQVSTPDVAGCT